VRWGALTALAVGLAGCGGGGSNPNSSCPPFAQIVGGDFGETGDALWWTLEVAALPDTMTFNRAEVPDNVLEYRWAVDLDIDGNGETDLQLAAAHWKAPNAAEIAVSDILAATQEDLWSVSGAGGAKIGSVDATLTGTTFRFEAAVSAAPGLAAIGDRDQMTWTTRYQSTASERCEDRWP
jgi:hypothetical protein